MPENFCTQVAATHSMNFNVLDRKKTFAQERGTKQNDKKF